MHLAKVPAEGVISTLALLWYSMFISRAFTGFEKGSEILHVLLGKSTSTNVVFSVSSSAKAVRLIGIPSPCLWLALKFLEVMKVL